MTQHQESNICSRQPAYSGTVVSRNADGTVKVTKRATLRPDAYFFGGNMSHVTLAGVQTILGLGVTYPYFETWDETIKFDVAGVHVTAVVTYSYRRETIKICQPHQIDGSTYGFCFEPPLFVLGVTFETRKRLHEAADLTPHDYWLKTAQKLYRVHVIYLKNKPEIDIAQQQFLSKIHDQLAMLRYKSTIANEQFRLSRSTLRQMLRERTIAQREYQQNLATFRAEMKRSLNEFHSFQSEVNRELDAIKMTFIDRALSAG